MFLGIRAVLTNPAEGTGNLNALGYDCSYPSDIMVYDAEALCQSDRELPGEKTSIKIVQLVENKELKGFKCRITTHCKSYYCGLFSYSKSSCTEQKETIMVSTSTCGQMSLHKPAKVRQ